tara:strand:+ start:484 stop:732 length:249 start_codon:yes stop_codon:yes gene_type:complete
MFGSNIGLHIIKFPTSRFGYVGSVPASCCKRMKADRSAVMGGRAVREGEELVEYRTMSFETQKEAIDHATMCGFEAKLPVAG